MVEHTEKQLQLAFELGVSVGLGAAQDKISFSEALKLLENTPAWVNRTNSELFIWSDVSLDEVKKVILAWDARDPCKELEALRAQFEVNPAFVPGIVNAENPN